MSAEAIPNGKADTKAEFIKTKLKSLGITLEQFRAWCTDNTTSALKVVELLWGELDDDDRMRYPSRPTHLGELYKGRIRGKGCYEEVAPPPAIVRCELVDYAH